MKMWLIALVGTLVIAAGLFAVAKKVTPLSWGM